MVTGLARVSRAPAPALGAMCLTTFLREVSSGGGPPAWYVGVAVVESGARVTTSLVCSTLIVSCSPLRLQLFNNRYRCLRSREKRNYIYFIRSDTKVTKSAKPSAESREQRATRDGSTADLRMRLAWDVTSGQGVRNGRSSPVFRLGEGRRCGATKAKAGVRHCVALSHNCDTRAF